MSEQKFSTFKDFYPYYLQEHQHPVCRALHYCGSTLVLLVLAYAIFSRQWHWLWAMPLVGYGFAWIGHFFIEHNKPATFKYPLYSLLGDWVMYTEFLSGRLAASLAASDPKRR